MFMYMYHCSTDGRDTRTLEAKSNASMHTAVVVHLHVDVINSHMYMYMKAFKKFENEM